MAPQHGPRRARIAFSDAAAKQVEAISSETELHALDRALVVISVDPEAGLPIPDAARTGLRLREYTDAIERVRLLYWTSALGTVVVVAYIEV